MIDAIVNHVGEPHRVAMLAFFAWVAYEHNRRDA